MEEFFFISFESTSYALQAEDYLKSHEFSINIIPTPREVSQSCGLSIKVNGGSLDKIKEIIDDEKIRVKGVYNLKNEKGVRKVEKIY